MSKKYIAIENCEFNGILYRAGSEILVDDKVEICNLYWKTEAEFKAMQEQHDEVKSSVEYLSSEEKTAKIEELVAELKETKKALASKKKEEKKEEDVK